MTDEQIIIDGVDVKGCKRRIGKDNFCRYYKRPCTENNYNCIWKKYLRKERECESWKALIDEAQIEQGKLQQQLEAYKMEAEEGKEINAELKAELEQEKNWHKTSDEISKVNSEYTAKLKQTLTEIKPILELYANSKMGEEQQDGTYKLSGGIWDGLGICTTTYDPKPAREGLKKISECEVEDEV